MKFPRKAGRKPFQHPPQQIPPEHAQGIQDDVVNVEASPRQNLPALDAAGDTQSRQRRPPPVPAPPQQGGKKAEGQEHDHVPNYVDQAVPLGKGDQVHPVLQGHDVSAEDAVCRKHLLSLTVQGKIDPVEEPGRSRGKGNGRHAAGKHPEKSPGCLPERTALQSPRPHAPPPGTEQQHEQQRSRRKARRHIEDIAKNTRHPTGLPSSAPRPRRAEPARSPSPAGRSRR